MAALFLDCRVVYLDSVVVGDAALESAIPSNGGPSSTNEDFEIMLMDNPQVKYANVKLRMFN